MKRGMVLLAACCMIFWLAACGGESGGQAGAGPVTGTGQTAETAGALTQEQALEAVKRYCFRSDPELESMAGSDGYTIYWDVTTNEADEIVVLYRSYTGSETRFYIDPDSGETRVTERVPGIIDEEQPAEEDFDVRDYLGD